jgi:hypothetical protein
VYCDVSKEHAAFSSVRKNKTKRKPVSHQAKSSENGGDVFLRNVVEFQLTTRRYIPEDITLYRQHSENLKFSIDKAHVAAKLTLV